MLCYLCRRFSELVQDMVKGAPRMKAGRVMTQAFVLIFLLQGVHSRTSGYTILTLMFFTKYKIIYVTLIARCAVCLILSSLYT